MLEYVLEENLLTDDPEDFRAQVVNVVSYTQNDIIERIMRIGAGLTRSDVLSVLEAEKQVVCEIVEDGGAVTTELFNIFPSIGGNFDGATDTFDSSRHRVRINLRIGTALRNVVGDVKPKKVTTGITSLSVLAVTDVKTGSMNNLLTPNRNLRIAGQKLKIAGNVPEAGVWFINQDDGERVQVEASDIVTNKPSELIIIIPELRSGSSYKLEIVTCFTGGVVLLKTPHTTQFNKVLTVV
jgi:hypothetical protein